MHVKHFIVNRKTIFFKRTASLSDDFAKFMIFLSSFLFHITKLTSDRITSSYQMPPYFKGRGSFSRDIKGRGEKERLERSDKKEDLQLYLQNKLQDNVQGATIIIYR